MRKKLCILLVILTACLFALCACSSEEPKIEVIDPAAAKARPESLLNNASVSIGGDFAVGLSADGLLRGAGNDELRQIDFPTWRSLTGLATGETFTLVIQNGEIVLSTGSADGEAWTRAPGKTLLPWMHAPMHRGFQQPAAAHPARATRTDGRISSILQLETNSAPA